MASFDAVISVVAQVDKALKGVRRIENAIKKIESTSLDIKVKEQSINKITQQAGAIESAFLKASKAAQNLTAFAKAFASSFIAGPAEELARFLQAANKESKLLLSNTAGYVKILKTVAEENKYITELSRRRRIEERANATTLASVEGRIARISAAQDKLVNGSKAQANAANKLNQLEEERNIILRQRESQLKRIRAAQEDIADTVRRNVRASKASRADSGFSGFSTSAGAKTAVDRSIRRQRQLLARRPKAAIESGPLALPSTEILRATERGLKRIDTTEQKIAESVAKLNREQQSAIVAQQKRNKEAQRLASLQDKIIAGSKAVSLGRDAGFGQLGPGNAAGIRQYEKRIKLIKLANNLEKNFTKGINSLRVKQDAARYRLEQRRIKALADKQKKVDKENADFKENLALGAGFPLLFGAGPGGVAGGVLGAVAGRGGSGFGLQILFSAFGSQLDEAFIRIQDISQAIDAIDVNGLVERNVRITAELRDQVDLLLSIGQAEAARLALSEEVADATGTLPGVTEDVGNAVNLLNASWNKVVNSVGALLGIIGAPFVAALAAVLELVARITQVFTGALSLIGKGLKIAVDYAIELVAGKDAAEGIADAIEDANGAMDEAIAKAKALRVELNQAVVESAKDLKFEQSLTTGTTFDDKVANAELKAKRDIDRLDTQQLNEAIQIRKENAKAGKETVEGLLAQNEAAFNNKKAIRQVRLEREKEGLQIRENTRLENEQNKAARERERERKAAERAAEKYRRDLERALKEEQRVQQQLAQYDIQKYDAAIRLIQATEGEAAAIKEQLRNQDALLAKRIEVINLSDKDQRLKEQEIQLAQTLAKVERQNLRTKQQELILQSELNKLKAEQEYISLRTGLDQELAGLSLGESPAEKQRREQADRYVNTLQETNNKIAEQQVLISNIPTPNREAIDAATLQLDNLNAQKQAYENLLPAIFAAEQQQLAYNQAFAAITPAVNSLVGGLREVVAGTKTAEEAFADFLTTIADQLINTAATMIAQFLAIGIARRFAFGGNPGASGFNLSGGGSSVGSGSLPGIDSLGGLFNGALPFIGVDALATGGTASGGQPYIVGEEGPELFIPGVTGTVTNNDQFEAARNALSDGSAGDAFDENGEALSNSSSSISNQGGSSSSSSISSQGGSTSNYYSQNGEALAAISRSFSENNNSLATSSSYMRERAIERERQTTVGSGGNMTIETQVINNVEYATVEQVALASAASAKQARAQVFSDMKNRPAIRRQVGVK